MATTLTLVTAIAVPIFIALLTLFIAPSITKRQTDKRLRETEERQARKEQAAAERLSIKEQAQQEAALSHLEKMVELREFFAVETARQKRLTDGELDRANAEISRAKEKIEQLSDRVEELTRVVAQLAPKQ